MQCVSLLQNLCTLARQYIALLFYIILRSVQKCVAGNTITKITVYCLMSVCSCFVMVLKFCIVRTVMQERCGYGMAGGYFTDVVLHSFKNYHQERAN